LAFLALLRITTFFVSVTLQISRIPAVLLFVFTFCWIKQILSKCETSENLLISVGGLHSDLEAIKSLRLLREDRNGVKENDRFTSRFGSAGGEFDVNQPFFEIDWCTLANAKSQMALD
jgi:hypothetical protein